MNEFASTVERHRRELLVHCYRMLGSLLDATRRVLTIWRSPCARLGRKHPSFASFFHDEQPVRQCDELPARVTVLWRPALDRPPLEGIYQYWRTSFVKTAQFLRIPQGLEHGFPRLTLFRHISPLSR